VAGRDVTFREVFRNTVRSATAALGSDNDYEARPGFSDTIFVSFFS
jgi:hypothetical protein